MNRIMVRQESSLNSFLTQPFEVGIRHLKVAFCNGTQKTLIEMAKERIIYRPNESNSTYSPLTKKQRFYHFFTGVLETVGYITIIIPLMVVLNM